MNRVFRYFRGYSKIRVEGKNVKRFFKSCVNRDIILDELELSESLIYANVINSSLEDISKLAQKTSVSMRILSSHGLPELFKILLRHPIKVSFTVLIILIYIYLNSRVLRITIDGNSSLSDEILLEKIKEAGVSIFSSIKQIDCAEIEYIILENYENVKWCSVFINGNVLNVLIDEEGIITDTPAPAGNCVSNVYGTVKEIYIRSGYSEIKPGDVVMPGDLLISGTIPITNSYDEVIGERQVVPDGDVIIEFTCCEQIVQPLTASAKIYTGDKEKGVDFYWNNSKLFSYLPSISYESCDIITENRGINVFGIDLPINLTTYEIYDTEYIIESYSHEEASEMLVSKYERIIKSYYDSGYEVIISDYSITPFTDCLSLSYNITVSGPAYSYE